MALVSHQELKLDATAADSFLRFLSSLPEKPSTTFRFFDRVDYYTTHGDDATYIARHIYKTNTVIKYTNSGKKQVKYVVLNKNTFETTVRDLLLVRHYRVEVYKGKEGRRNDWELRYKGSPGNLAQFEDVLFSKVDLAQSVGMLAIKTESNKKIGIAYADATVRKLEIIEFEDNDQLSTLEAVLVQKAPKECIIATGDTPGFDKKHLHKVIKRSGVLLTERKKSEFTAKDLVQDLNRLLRFKKGEKADALVRPELEKTTATAALAAVVRYMELLSDDTNLHQFTLALFDTKQYMRLDPAAVRALNLKPSRLEGTRSTKNINGLLNKCRTPQGQRLLAQWVKQPLIDLNQINERHNVVEALLNNTELRQALYDDHLRRIPDFQKLSKKFQRKRATLQDCYRVYQAVKRIPMLTKAISAHTGEHNDLLNELFARPVDDLVKDFAKFVQMVDATLDMAQVRQGDYVIKAEFDENLQQLRDTMEQLEANMRDLVKGAARDLKLEPLKQLKFESNHQLGYYFRVTRKDEKNMRGNRNYTIIDTKKDGVRFRNKELRDLNEEYMDARAQYQEVQRAVVAEVIGIAAGYHEPMLTLSDHVARLDVLVAFAQASAMAPIPYVRPKMLPLGSGYTKLTQARHPCMEVQDDVNYIPNDAYFERDKQMFHIITGPNMGGKSTYIRSVGCVVLLAQVGCFVPCEQAEITVMDSILARVGAGDSQFKGVSTFMAEMLETAAILRTATENSLMIIDELGRGTSTYDGFGLAWAISEHVARDIGGMCLFATHFHELTDLSDAVPTINNLHVTAIAGEGTLTLLYKVTPGACDQSFGVHVAKMVSFPQHVVEKAARRARQLEDYQSIDLRGTGLEGVGLEPQKRRKTERKAGEQLVANFMEQLGALPADTLSDEQLEQEVAQLREQVLKQDNIFIKDLLARGEAFGDDLL